MTHTQSAFHPKICILSAAGGCGKTTLAVNLFRPFLENPLMLFMGPFPETMFSLWGMEAHFMRGSEVNDLLVQTVVYADRPVIADSRPTRRMFALMLQNQSNCPGTNLRGKLLHRIAHQTFFSGE
ncbi:hypothetical protein AAJCM20276_36150 (plasmid) [Acetobacter aceti]|uniref:Uncharacterized protein n=1 Tax=Acetobacter aceti TaxID=435 RepID=A0A6S6PQN1_ACEAC|nr:hypothetical protein [Acetobacter aceti]BCI68991.1 hypothetical protein AAJCM20276_36150 [Acetobacter aceti]